MFIAGFISPIAIAIMLLKKQHHLEEEWYDKTIGALYEGVKTHYKWAVLYSTIFIVRRLIFSGVALLMDKFPAA